jgi:hypothetical protein
MMMSYIVSLLCLNRAHLAERVYNAARHDHKYCTLPKQTREMLRDQPQAQTVFARAREILRALALKLDDERLRQGFLAAEPARRLLAEQC